MGTDVEQSARSGSGSSDQVPTRNQSTAKIGAKTIADFTTSNVVQEKPLRKRHVVERRRRGRLKRDQGFAEARAALRAILHASIVCCHEVRTSRVARTKNGCEGTRSNLAGSSA